MINPTVSPSPAKTRQSALLRVAVVLILTIATVLAYHHRDALDPVQLTVWVQSWGTAGMAIFVLLYILATVLFLPGSVLTLAGGALFMSRKINISLTFGKTQLIDR